MTYIDSLKKRLRPGQLGLALFDTLKKASFFIKDSDRRFVTGNAALAKGLNKRGVWELLGKTDHELIADFLADAFMVDDNTVLLEGKSIINKVELVPIGRTLEWQVTTKLPLYATDDSIIGLAGITRRIDESDTDFREHPEMEQIINYVQQNYVHSISKAEMADAAGISQSTLERLFRKTFGITPGRYARRVRLNAACRLITETDQALAEIAPKCGFKDQTYMTHAFRSELKLTPHKYRLRYSETG